MDAQKREERRRHLLDCAAEVFSERGYAHVTVDDVHRRAGVARGTFYLYFKDKGDIFSALIEDFFVQLRLQIRRIDLESSTPPLEQLRGNLERVTSLTQREPELTRLVLEAAAGIDPALDERLTRFWSSVLELIESSLIEGQAMGLVRSGDPALLARMGLGAIKELLLAQHSQRSSKAGQGGYPPKELAEALMTFVSRGLLH